MLMPENLENLGIYPRRQYFWRASPYFLTTIVIVCPSLGEPERDANNSVSTRQVVSIANKVK